MEIIWCEGGMARRNYNVLSKKYIDGLNQELSNFDANNMPTTDPDQARQRHEKRNILCTEKWQDALSPSCPKFACDIITWMVVDRVVEYAKSSHGVFLDENLVRRLVLGEEHNTNYQHFEA